MSTKLGCVARLVRQNARRFTTSEKRYITEAEVQKIKKKQEYYQSSNEPIHLITGKTHFYITTAFGVATIIISGKSIYRMLTR